MKSGKWNLAAAIGDLAAAVCFALAAMFHGEAIARALCGAAAACFLAGGIGFLYGYIKEKRQSR